MMTFCLVLKSFLGTVVENCIKVVELVIFSAESFQAKFALLVAENGLPIRTTCQCIVLLKRDYGNPRSARKSL